MRRSFAELWILPVAGILSVGAMLAGESAAAAPLVHPFSVSLSVINQCTGEPMAVTLEGSVSTRLKASGLRFAYEVQSQIQGTAVGETTGTSYRFNGNEKVDVDSATPDLELTLANNVRMLTRGGPAVFLGYDEQTISIDPTGAIARVDHRFDFSCD